MAIKLQRVLKASEDVLLCPVFVCELYDYLKADDCENAISSLKELDRCLLTNADVIINALDVFNCMGPSGDVFRLSKSRVVSSGHEAICELWFSVRSAIGGAIGLHQQQVFPHVVRPNPNGYYSKLRSEWQTLRQQAFMQFDNEFLMARVARERSSLRQMVGKVEDSPDEDLTTESRALAILVDHPDWPAQKIADELGITRPHLYRIRGFSKARKIQAENRSTIPRGSKDSNGNMDAWDASDDDS